MEIPNIVIGSGPAGVACAKALLARGARVLMLDAGLELETEKAQLVQSLAGKEPDQLTSADRLVLKGNVAPMVEGLPKKLIFGSDFPYRDTAKEIPWRASGVGLEPSLALGGFSNVWGSAMLPHCDADMADWPVKNAELAEHYRAVTAFTGLSAQGDDLAEIFPLYCDRPQPVQSSRQADLLLKRLLHHRKALRDAGWRFGHSRIAVRAAATPAGAGCQLCGLCLSGCPYGCIFNSADTVREMRYHPHFNYRRDCIITSLNETFQGVTVNGHDRRNQAPFSLATGRVYLATGVIPTALILLRSKVAYDQPLRLRDSQYFLVPLLLGRRHSQARAEPLHTLSQLFMELNDPDISARTIHLQLYTYSETISQAVRRSLGVLRVMSPSVAERLIVIQGYLHSDESSSIKMTLKREGHGDYLQLDALPNAGTRSKVKKVLRALLRQSHRFGGVVLSPLLQMTLPGRGFHSGGSLPMRHQPGAFESDCLGRPCGWSRVHVVDASVLPSIPATTITFTVMANAHRIGWESAGI